MLRDTMRVNSLKWFSVSFLSIKDTLQKSTAEGFKPDFLLWRNLFFLVVDSRVFKATKKEKKQRRTKKEIFLFCRLCWQKVCSTCPSLSRTHRFQHASKTIQPRWRIAISDSTCKRQSILSCQQFLWLVLHHYKAWILAVTKIEVGPAYRRSIINSDEPLILHIWSW